MSAIHERLCEACLRVLGDATAWNDKKMGELSGVFELNYCRELAGDWVKDVLERDAFAEFLKAQRAERFQLGYAQGCADRQHLLESGDDLAAEVLRLRKAIESGDFKDIYAEGLMLGQKLGAPPLRTISRGIEISVSADASADDIAKATGDAMRQHLSERGSTTREGLPSANAFERAMYDVRARWLRATAKFLEYVGREMDGHEAELRREVSPRADDPKRFEKLWCPWCGKRHVDLGEFASRPHHTHRCVDDPWWGAGCGREWRLVDYVFGRGRDAGDPPERKERA